MAAYVKDVAERSGLSVAKTLTILLGYCREQGISEIDTTPRIGIEGKQP